MGVFFKSFFLKNFIALCKVDANPVVEKTVDAIPVVEVDANPVVEISRCYSSSCGRC